MSEQRVTPQELKRLFGEEGVEYEAETKQRWGDTDAWQESRQRTKSYGRSDWAAIKAESDALLSAMAEAYAAGVDPSDIPAMDLVEAHRRHITRWFYDCSPQMQIELGVMYVSDPRFTAAYDETYAAPGLAQWVSDAIRANAAR